jgi:hypothetical protein
VDRSTAQALALWARSRQTDAYRGRVLGSTD